MGNTIGGFFVFIAIIGVLCFALGFMALLNMDLPTDSPMVVDKFPNNLFAFFKCEVDCIKNIMGISLAVIVLGGAIGGFILKNS